MVVYVASKAAAVRKDFFDATHLNKTLAHGAAVVATTAAVVVVCRFVVVVRTS